MKWKTEMSEDNQKCSSSLFVYILFAIVLLIIIAASFTYTLRNELVERPFLLLFILLAWLGALVGIDIGST
jgi:prepilin signal peptidase PulO-like enzyme (type II secretory pathway)